MEEEGGDGGRGSYIGRGGNVGKGRGGRKWEREREPVCVREGETASI
jgi:hypothetical protein